jgi:hypothetical protein
LLPIIDRVSSALNAFCDRDSLLENRNLVLVGLLLIVGSKTRDRAFAAAGLVQVPEKEPLDS